MWYKAGATAVKRMATISADRMNKQILKDVMQRVETWPDADQAEVLEYALEIEARCEDGPYHASPEELKGIDRGLRDAAEGRFATDEEVKAVFAKFRHGQ
jgi:hypothetical protein